MSLIHILGALPPESPPDGIAVEVAGRGGSWVAGFELLATNSDGTATIRSSRTGAVRRLWPDQWRDPLEATVMAANRSGVA